MRTMNIINLKKYRKNYLRKCGASSNKRYTLRRLIGGSGLRSARSFRFAPFPRLTPPTFCKPWSCYASPYSGLQNVVYLERYAKVLPIGWIKFVGIIHYLTKIK